MLIIKCDQLNVLWPARDNSLATCCYTLQPVGGVRRMGQKGASGQRVNPIACTGTGNTNTNTYTIKIRQKATNT